MRPIDADELRRRMYEEVFEKDSEEQRKYEHMHCGKR